jgi:hypothetical protein
LRQVWTRRIKDKNEEGMLGLIYLPAQRWWIRSQSRNENLVSSYLFRIVVVVAAWLWSQSGVDINGPARRARFFNDYTADFWYLGVGVVSGAKRIPIKTSNDDR